MFSLSLSCKSEQQSLYTLYKLKYKIANSEVYEAIHSGKRDYMYVETMDREKGCQDRDHKGSQKII